MKTLSGVYAQLWEVGLEVPKYVSNANGMRRRMHVSCFRLGMIGFVLLITACAAKPVREVVLPSSAYESQVPTPPAAPVAAPTSGAIGTAVAEASAPRIDEFYPASGESLDPTAAAASREHRAVGDITLDFVDADLRDVIRAILGDILALNFVIDPDVNGRVTLSTNHPIDEAGLLPTLEAVLATHGVKLLAYDTLYRVTRSTAPSALAGGGIDVAPTASGDNASYRIFPLRYIVADHMKAILEPLLPDGAIVYADAVRNILILAGNGDELRLASSTVDIFDVNQMVGQNVHLISLQKADASEITAELESIFAANAQTAEGAGLVQFIPISRLNAILIISKQRAYVEEARKWIYRLDRRLDATKPRIYVYYVQHGQAKDLADSLRGVIGFVGGYGAAPVAGPVAASADLSAASSSRSASPYVANILGPSMGISVDNSHNALLISATPDQFELIEEVLARIDIQPLQVMIETSIFEITLRDELRYGLQFALNNGGLGFASDGSATLTRNTTIATSAAGLVTPFINPLLPGFSFSLEGTSEARFIIDTLSAITEVNMLSSPNVIVLNNQVARLRVGDEVPIVTQTTTSAVTDDPLIINSVQYRSTGVNLEVTPRVNASGMITLEVSQEVSDVVVTTTSTIDSPTIQNRFLLTTVSVRSGETVMLGGLIREESTDSESGIPFLHQLPFIGSLFGQTDTTSARTELVLLIRPVIISSPEDARAMTNDMRGKFIALLQRERTAIRQPRRLINED